MDVPLKADGSPNLQFLKELGCGMLARKRDSVRRMAAYDHRYRDQLIAKGVPLPDLPNDIDDPSLEMLLKLAAAIGIDIGEKAFCYNVAGRIQMICYAVAQIADPLILISAGGKAGVTLTEFMKLSAGKLELDLAARGSQAAASSTSLATVPTASTGLSIPRLASGRSAIAAPSEVALLTDQSRAGAKGLLTGQKLPSSPVPAENPHRPSETLVPSHPERLASEVHSSGWFLKSPADFDELVRTGQIKNGTYVMLVVRRNGEDYLMMVPRIPDSENILANRINTHRSLMQKYEDLFGEKANVVDAGECLISAAGVMFGCNTRTGTFRTSTLSHQYLADVADSFHVRRKPYSNVQLYIPEPKPVPGSTTKSTFTRTDVGHVEGEAAVAMAKQLTGSYPGTVERLEQFSLTMQRKYPGDNPSGMSADYLKRYFEVKRAAKLAPDGAARADAYARINQFFLESREGIVEAFQKTKAGNIYNKRPPEEGFDVINTYYEDFIRDIENSP